MSANSLEYKALTGLSVQELLIEYNSTAPREIGRRQKILKYILNSEIPFRKEFFDGLVKQRSMDS